MFLSSFLPFSSLEALQLHFLAHVSGFVCFLPRMIILVSYICYLCTSEMYIAGGMYFPVHPN